MKELALSIEEIKELMASMNKHCISSLKLEQEGFSLRLEGSKGEAVVLTPPPLPVALPASDEDSEEPSYPGTVIRSPIVGTFYAAPAPGKEPYVKVGSRIKKGDVLFLIESMKLMNEVLADQDGTVCRILVENAQGVEYGQPILCIE